MEAMAATPPPLSMPLGIRGQDNLGCPKSRRGITAVAAANSNTETCIKFVHLEVDAVPVPCDESFEEDWEMHDWTITTWSNTKLGTSLDEDDWHMDSEVKASRTTVSSKLEWKLLKYGLLLSPDGEGEQPRRAFQNILVTFPVPGIEDDVVFLQARLRFRDPKVFVLALDTRNNKLLGAVEFATEKNGAGVMYFPSNIGKYIDPESRCLPIPEDDEDDSNWED